MRTPGQELLERYAARRAALLKRCGAGVLVLGTAPEQLRNGDVHHPFRPGSDLDYLTGFPEPGAVLVLRQGTGRSAGKPKATLFVRPRDKAREQWDGPRFGTTRAKRAFGLDEVHPIGELDQRLPDLLAGHGTLHLGLGRDPDLDRRVLAACRRVAAKARRQSPPRHPAIRDPGPDLAAMRLVKDGVELAAMERAVDATVAGHRVAMGVARPGLYEYQVQAELEAAFRHAGSPRNGFETICASGPNACVLHHVENDRRMRAGDLLLVDAGAEVDGYTGDITRTFPVSGRFTEPQKAVYQAVLKALAAATRAVKPGAVCDAPHKAAVRSLTKSLVQLGVLRGEPTALIKKDAYKPWFMHGTSHWLGRDVHDVGPYQDHRGKPVRLKPGMVLTVEPGLYFQAGDRKVPAELRGIGVRIEDDVAVTHGGHRVLTEGVPKSVRDVEALCRAGEE